MKLRSLVRGAINVVNRDQPIIWLASQGYTLNSSGIAVPDYAAPQVLYGQIQPLPTASLAHMEQLNIQGVLRQVYLRGAVATAVRANGTGGDLLIFPERFCATPPGSEWTADSSVSADSNQSVTGGTPPQDWTADSSTTADSSLTVDGSRPVYVPPPRTWLVVLVNEQWESWCLVTAQLQNDQNTAWTADSGTPADSYSTASG